VGQTFLSVQSLHNTPIVGQTFLSVQNPHNTSIVGQTFLSVQNLHNTSIVGQTFLSVQNPYHQPRLSAHQVIIQISKPTRKTDRQECLSHDQMYLNRLECLFRDLCSYPLSLPVFQSKNPSGICLIGPATQYCIGSRSALRILFHRINSKHGRKKKISGSSTIPNPGVISNSWNT